MSISSINYGSSLLGLSVRKIGDQLSDLSTQLSTGLKSSNYGGMGPDEGFAIAARAQLANISSFTTTMTHVNTVIQAVNTGLQSLSSIQNQVQSAAAATPQNLTSTGQTIGQQAALSNLSAIVGILNTQVGDRYIYSGNGVDKPAMAPADDILNGTATQAGLKQVISERQQADLGTGLGRLVLSASAAMPITLNEDVAGSPFGLKLNAVTSTLTNATVTGPTGSPATISVDLTAGNPNPGDQIKIQFNLPDGTTDSIQLTASSTTPQPANTFAIGATPAATSANLNAALNTALGTLANTSLVAASAVEAGNNFFSDGMAVGSAVNSKAAAPITGATLLSGAAASNSIATNFAAGDTITVNGTTLSFVASGATGNQLNVTDSVQTLLSKIDQITGTATPSTISATGAITINTNDAPDLSISSSNSAAFASLGFSGTVTASYPLRVSGAPLSSATSLAASPATTVAWYTGNNTPGGARASSTIRIDTAQSIKFGAQGNEEAIRRDVQQIAVYAAVTISPTGTNSGKQVAALSQRIAANLTPQLGQQTVSDIQTDFATAQTAMKDATGRQNVAKAALQSLIDQTEGIAKDQVASEILQLQTNLQASYQTTSMLSQLTLVKFL